MLSCLLATVLLAAVGIILLLPRTDPVDYHLRKLELIRKVSVYPNCPMPGINRYWLTWTLHGQPSYQECNRQYARHEESLVKLGYLKKKSFLLKYIPLNFQTVGVLQRFLGPQIPYNHITSLEPNYSNATLTVTLLAEDMAVFEKAVHEFDREDQQLGKLFQQPSVHDQAPK
jgi:hypothetical protein